jgi:hypothetical protein
LAPDCSATAVRDPLVDTAKPWKHPAARLAVPMRIISWFGSTSSPRRAAKLVEVAMVSVSETNPIRIIPTKIAIIPASAIAVDGSSPATTNGASAAKMRGETEESGPSTKTRDGPMSAYPVRHAIVVYRPVTGGRPASSA